ncbi:NucA/NucB deoxyribonuclease domain-containing protein [Kitasatospora sp. McL0602]|uniref:NucA/NucB deoxyribonuclease domain-containing protein n=1 Tax=Kitasatospora sp. McL0602 TaxID=3439530 RepID=UPI003F8AE2C4
MGASPAAAAPPTAGRAGPTGHGTCTPTTPGSGAQRQGAAWTCTRQAPVSAQGLARIRATATATARDTRAVPPGYEGAAALCASDKHQDVVSNRHAYCVRHNIIYALIDPKGDVIGTAPLTVTAASEPSPTSTQWQESISVYAGAFSETIPSLQLSLASDCTQCTAGPPAWGGGSIELVQDGEDHTGTLSYDSTVRGGGMQQRTQIAYRSQTLSTDADPVIAQGTWAGPSLRCDGQVGGNPGCIVTEDLAKVTISKAAYGAAAVAYEWAQKNLSDNNSMGTEKRPLTRDADDKRADSRRYYSCDAPPMPFVKDPTVQDDSCDEFPFAKTRQGGTLGSLCTEITPRNVGGVWSVQVVRDEPVAPCIRAHVPKGENTGAGGKLGRDVQSERILDGEAYQVVITP